MDHRLFVVEPNTHRTASRTVNPALGALVGWARGAGTGVVQVFQYYSQGACQEIEIAGVGLGTGLAS